MAETIEHVAYSLGRVRHQCRWVNIRRGAYDGVAAHAHARYRSGNRGPKPLTGTYRECAFSGEAQLSKVALADENALVEVAVSLDDHRLVEQPREQSLLFPSGVLHLIQVDQGEPSGKLRLDGREVREQHLCEREHVRVPKDALACQLLLDFLEQWIALRGGLGERPILAVQHEVRASVDQPAHHRFNPFVILCPPPQGRLLHRPSDSLFGKYLVVDDVDCESKAAQCR
ncbi:hypothetical protein SDC9_77887 [bioreactor metagenome]|uniref:Uncharacterized protein n=1 Tax=bioreactor metagenome TaxID=1076179 RepID=A0A644YRW4_9ZZZZ